MSKESKYKRHFILRFDLNKFLSGLIAFIALLAVLGMYIAWC